MLQFKNIPKSGKGYMTMPKRPYPRYQRRHHAILLAVCRDPGKKQKDIAKIKLATGG
jgi:hypothetical protein